MKCILCNQEIKNEVDPENSFTDFYRCSKCGTFYVEPIFKRKLEIYISLHGRNENYEKILTKMQEICATHPIVVFTDDIDNAISNVKDAIYVEFRDVTDLANVYINDISRGSDYGD